jgi:hypothetical protein
VKRFAIRRRPPASSPFEGIGNNSSVLVFSSFSLLAPDELQLALRSYSFSGSSHTQATKRLLCFAEKSGLKPCCKSRST